MAKFNTIRPHFFQKNIFPDCYFITEEDPTSALIDAGRAQFVKVFSARQYFDSILGIFKYSSVRKKAAFGSAVDIYSREPDNYKYVPVTYYSDNGDKYSIERIASELVKGRTIVLIGDYGSGKSRCTKEVFEQIIDSHPHHLKNPISINLRDNWGLNRAQEILTRHFTDLGMNDIINDVMKVAYTSSIIYLLDGFDEIGAQTWSDDPTKLVSIRQRSLVGVKELIADSKGGILITGREHYFNNDAELITCLGLDKKSPIFIRCNQELSGEQFSNMLGSTFSSIPLWMPKKPLIAAIMRSIEPTVLKQLFSSSQGEFDFWNMLIDAFCIREANINKILDQEIIRSLYTKIARLARQTKTPLGPISIKQINDAFEQTTGRPPTDESAIVLQRLPGLSRIGAESLDRQFIDTYILDGLKAEDVIDIYSTGNSNIMKSTWINPLDDFGYRMISSRVVDSNQAGLILSFIKRHINEDNKILLSDLMSSLFLIDESPIDFNGCVIERGKFSAINFSNESIRNIIFSDCYF